MAKQRRPAPRVATRKPSRLASRRTTRRRAAKREAPPRRLASRPGGPSGRPAESVATAPPSRPAHLDAVALYEQGLQALQQHNYARAADLLRSVLERYPEEKELHERVRLYLNVCERQAVPPDATPQTLEERVYAATLAINAGHYDRGLALLDALREDAPDNDHVHYMLAVVHVLRGEIGKAIPHLQRAVELNAENRLLAFQDADLDAARQDPMFRSVVEAASQVRRDRRAARGRAPR